MKKLLKPTLIMIFIAGLLSCNSKPSNTEARFPNLTSGDQKFQQTELKQPSDQTSTAPEAEEDLFTAEFLFDFENAVKDDGQKAFGTSTGFELTAAMKTGWNLGNTFDATGSSGMPSEMSWGQPHTEKEMIDGLARSGIKTIRIPVTWHNHITDKSNYTIHPEWMARVKTVVDWAIADGMYVIINSHHDNYEKPAKMLPAHGYYPNSTNLADSQRFLYNIWGQIATAFNNGYDEHLIFETMNEPRPAGTSSEWWFGGDSRSLDAAKCLNQMNQTALDAIRSTGGNNAKRFVMCPALQASENSASASAFKMPVDSAEGRLILSIHAYTPYSFAMEAPGERSFTQAHKNELNTMFAKLKKKFIDNGYPVVIGEYGATNKDNLQERLAWFDYYISTAKAYGIPCCLWDNGVWQLRQDKKGNPDYSEGYGYYNRLEQSWYFPEITKTIIDACK